MSKRIIEDIHWALDNICSIDGVADAYEHPDKSICSTLIQIYSGNLESINSIKDDYLSQDFISETLIPLVLGIYNPYIAIRCLARRFGMDIGYEMDYSPVLRVLLRYHAAVYGDKNDIIIANGHNDEMALLNVFVPFSDFNVRRVSMSGLEDTIRTSILSMLRIQKTIKLSDSLSEMLNINCGIPKS